MFIHIAKYAKEPLRSEGPHAGRHSDPTHPCTRSSPRTRTGSEQHCEGAEEAEATAVTDHTASSVTRHSLLLFD